MNDPFSARASRIERSIQRTLSTARTDGEIIRLQGELPTEYIRGQLFLALVDAIDPGREADPHPIAVALELSYLQSLVHSRILLESEDVERTSPQIDHSILTGDYLQAQAYEWIGKFETAPEVAARFYTVLTRASVGIHEGQYAKRVVATHRRETADETDARDERVVPVDESVVRYDRTAAGVLGGVAVRLAGEYAALDASTLSDLEAAGSALGWQLTNDSVLDSVLVADPRSSIEGGIAEIAELCPETAAGDVHRHLTALAARTRERTNRAATSGRS